jgi:hypothetical protein
VAGDRLLQHVHARISPPAWPASKQNSSGPTVNSTLFSRA